MKIIEPKILKGTRDFLPQEVIARELVKKTIKEIFSKYGYMQIETPILNPAETILGKYGEEGDRLTYSFTDRGERKIALPYDLTVPMTRYVAVHKRELPMPFKRFQIQRVWRAERPQKGRLREFYQCDIDIIGSKSILCEIEITKIIIEVFTKLNIEDFTIQINTRKILNEVLSSFEVNAEQIVPAIRIIDKFDKIGRDEVIKELVDLKIKHPEDIIDLLSAEATNKKTLKKLQKFNTSEIESFFEYCKKMSISKDKIQFNPSLARGLDYYTGLIFEVVSKKVNFGTICAGGRYDNLGQIFGAKDLSGIGVAFGFERIMLMLKEMDKLPVRIGDLKVLVTIFDKKSIDDSLSIYKILTDNNISTELYFEPVTLSKQLKYANKKGVDFVIVQGPTEKENEEITIKKLSNGVQKRLSLKQMVLYIKGYYEAK